MIDPLGPPDLLRFLMLVVAAPLAAGLFGIDLVRRPTKPMWGWSVPLAIGVVLLVVSVAAFHQQTRWPLLPWFARDALCAAAAEALELALRAAGVLGPPTALLFALALAASTFLRPEGEVTRAVPRVALGWVGLTGLLFVLQNPETAPLGVMWPAATGVLFALGHRGSPRYRANATLGAGLLATAFGMAALGSSLPLVARILVVGTALPVALAGSRVLGALLGGLITLSGLAGVLASMAGHGVIRHGLVVPEAIDVHGVEVWGNPTQLPACLKIDGVSKHAVHLGPCPPMPPRPQSWIPRQYLAETAFIVEPQRPLSATTLRRMPMVRLGTGDEPEHYVRHWQRRSSQSVPVRLRFLDADTVEITDPQSVRTVARAALAEHLNAENSRASVSTNLTSTGLQGGLQIQVERTPFLTVQAFVSLCLTVRDPRGRPNFDCSVVEPGDPVQEADHG